MLLLSVMMLDGIYVHVCLYTCGVISELGCCGYMYCCSQVMAVAVGIATDWAVDHCMKWMHSKLRGIRLVKLLGIFFI